MLCVPDAIVRLVGQRSGLNDMENSAELRRGRKVTRKLPLYHAIDLPSKAASNLASCP